MGTLCQLLLLCMLYTLGVSLSIGPPEHGQASLNYLGGDIPCGPGKSPSGDSRRSPGGDTSRQPDGDPRRSPGGDPMRPPGGDTRKSRSGKGYELLFISNDKIWTNHSIQFDRALPSWLQGSHFHIGPGLFEMGSRKVTHTFDGFAKVNKFHFANGTAWYSSRFIASGYYEDSLQKESIAPYLLFDEVEPPFSNWETFLTYIHGVDNMNVNIKPIGDKLVALSDIWPFYVIDPASLKTIGKVLPAVPKSHFPVPSSAHPVQAINSSDHITFASVMNPIPHTRSYINVVRKTSASDGHLIASIAREWNHLPYMHSLAVSPNYAIIFAHPAFIDILKPLSMRPLLDTLVWKPELSTDVYVVRLKDGETTKLQTEAVFFSHHINSYEEENQIIIDYTTYSSPNVVGLLRGMELATQLNSSMRDALNAESAIKRLVIDLGSNTISVVNFQPTRGAEAANRLDMPSINGNCTHQKHCFVYGITFNANGEDFADYVLAKKDVCNPHNDKVWRRMNHYVSEPFFVPRPGATKEDDGLLMSVILDGQLKKSYIGVFDAGSLELISRGYLPDAIPFLIHGQFISLSQYDKIRGSG